MRIMVASLWSGEKPFRSSRAGRLIYINETISQ
jgi:hypothetical protein